MQTVSVYRVQHRLFGTGPYRLPAYSEMVWQGLEPKSARGLADFCENIVEAHTDAKHPLPIDDGLDTPYNYAFGFESLRQLRTWFATKWLRELSKHDFLLVEFDVPVGDVHYGARQVAFNPEFSAVLAEHPMLPGLAGRVRHVLR